MDLLACIEMALQYANVWVVKVESMLSITLAHHDCNKKSLRKIEGFQRKEVRTLLCSFSFLSILSTSASLSPCHLHFFPLYFRRKLTCLYNFCYRTIDPFLLLRYKTAFMGQGGIVFYVGNRLGTGLAVAWGSGCKIKWAASVLSHCHPNTMLCSEFFLLRELYPSLYCVPRFAWDFWDHASHSSLHPVTSSPFSRDIVTALSRAWSLALLQFPHILHCFFVFFPY